RRVNRRPPRFGPGYESLHRSRIMAPAPESSPHPTKPGLRIAPRRSAVCPVGPADGSWQHLVQHPRRFGDLHYACEERKPPPKRGFRETRQTGLEPVTFGFVVGQRYSLWLGLTREIALKEPNLRNCVWRHSVPPSGAESDTVRDPRRHHGTPRPL